MPTAGGDLMRYSVSPVTQADSASSAAGASSPSALSRNTVPPVAPSASTARMLFASASLPLTPTETFDRKRMAVLTNVAAGRARSATADGSATASSELACPARPLRRPRHVNQVLSRRRHRLRHHPALVQ